MVRTRLTRKEGSHRRLTLEKQLRYNIRVNDNKLRRLHMFELTKIIDDPSGIVSKLIFEGDGAVAEAVAYRYENRAVVCFSVQSGCPVGCKFCGTGSRFIRDLTTDEMNLQITEGLNVTGRGFAKTQIMSMSMGDPMLNWGPTQACAESQLDMGRDFFLSTVGIVDLHAIKHIMALGMLHKGFGLQLSLHQTKNRRQRLFRNPNLNYMTLDQLVAFGKQFTEATGKRAYFNYVAAKFDKGAADWIVDNLGGMHVTFSTLCSSTELVKGDAVPAQEMAAYVSHQSYDDVEISVFDPEGQDNIGGGCGQLLFVQEKMNGFRGIEND